MFRRSDAVLRGAPRMCLCAFAMRYDRSGRGSRILEHSRDKGSLMANQLAKIDSIVHLMLENRSFDHMLGFLYTDSGNRSPTTGQAYDGLAGDESNLDSSGNKVTVFRIDKNHPSPYVMPGCDPREGFNATNLQLFGVDSPASTARPSNSGFVTSFENAIAYDQTHGRPECQAVRHYGYVRSIGLARDERPRQGIRCLRRLVLLSSHGDLSQPCVRANWNLARLPQGRLHVTPHAEHLWADERCGT